MEEQFYKEVLVVILVLFIIFLIIRELNCWYWKINKRIELQTQTNDLLKKLLTHLSGEPNLETPGTERIKGKLESVKGIKLEILNKLTEKEKEELYIFLFYSERKPGTIVAMSKQSKKFKQFDQNQWAKKQNSSEHIDWLLIIDDNENAA